MQPDSRRKEAENWVASLDALELPGSLVREIFSTFLLLRWADNQEAEQEAAAVFEDRHFSPLLPAKLQWRYWCNLPPMEMGHLVARDICPYLESLGGLRESPLAIYLHALTDPLRRIAEINFVYLVNVIRWIANQPFETSNERHRLLEFFDVVTAETTSGYGHEGEHLTPPSIAMLAVAIADPRPGERLYDPCFGSAAFLTAALAHVEQAGSSALNRRGGVPLEVYGIDINRKAFVLGLTRLVLAGVNEPHLELGNSLERDAVSSPSREGFDVILANPPIGLKTTRETGSYDHYPILTSDATGLFIQHVLSQLKPQGRAVISVPQGVLFRGGAEQALRRQLVERGQLEAVIGLPAGAFSPFTHVKGSLLLLRKSGADRLVRMVDGSPFFEPPKRSRSATIRNPAIQQLTEIVRGQSSQHAWELSQEELAAADWDLTPRRREKGGLEALFRVLDDIRGDVSISQLSDCAQIFAGRSINARDLADKPEGERPVSYIRIRDIQKGAAVKGSGWVSAAALPGIEPKCRVLAGDVLLSKSGTIGKAGIVRNGAVGGIAANGLYVVRVDQGRLDPNFLIAYLSSAACQNWLSAQSRGSVIQHLNRAVLDQLPLPLPPLHLQQRAAIQHQEFGTDVLAFLTEATGAKELDRLSAWMSDMSQRIPSFSDGLDAPPSLTLVEPLVESAQIALRLTQNDEIAAQHLRWLMPLLEGLSMLTGVSQIPEGPSLLNVVQEAVRGFRLASSAASGHLPVEAQGRALAEQLAAWMGGWASALLAQAEIVVSPELSRMQAGIMTEFSVSATNSGALPLRAVRLETSPDWGSGLVAFLPEKQSFSLTLHGDTPKVAGVFTMELRWSAKTLDGQSVDGELQLAFDVFESEAEAIDVVELGGSPYITGSTAVGPDRGDVFFGRSSLIAQISRQIAESGNVVLLVGNRRAGKSSILKHLEGVGPVPGWLAVYWSFQAGESAGGRAVGVPTVEVFRGIAYELVRALRSAKFDAPLPNGVVVPVGGHYLGIPKACQEGISDVAPFTDFRDYLESVLAVLAQRDFGLLLMLDEFDKLQEGIDSGVTSPQVPENIRFLVQNYPRFSAILTGSNRLKRLREEYWSALYGLGTRVDVTALAEDDARQLVALPVKGKLTYSPESVDRAIAVTACQPYLLQCLCNGIFDFAARTKTRSVTLRVVEEACAALARDNGHFTDLWRYTESDRRRLILMLCAKESSRTNLVAFGELQELLTQCGVEVSNESLATDLDALRELELIDLVGKIGDGHYKLTIPLMRAWIEQQQDYQVVLRRAQAESEEENA